MKTPERRNNLSFTKGNKKKKEKERKTHTHT